MGHGSHRQSNSSSSVLIQQNLIPPTTLSFSFPCPQGICSRQLQPLLTVFHYAGYASCLWTTGAQVKERGRPANPRPFGMKPHDEQSIEGSSHYGSQCGTNRTKSSFLSLNGCESEGDYMFNRTHSLTRTEDSWQSERDSSLTGTEDDSKFERDSLPARTEDYSLFDRDTRSGTEDEPEQSQPLVIGRCRADGAARSTAGPGDVWTRSVSMQSSVPSNSSRDSRYTTEGTSTDVSRAQDGQERTGDRSEHQMKHRPGAGRRPRRRRPPSSSGQLTADRTSSMASLQSLRSESGTSTGSIQSRRRVPDIEISAATPSPSISRRSTEVSSYAGGSEDLLSLSLSLSSQMCGTQEGTEEPVSAEPERRHTPEGSQESCAVEQTGREINGQAGNRVRRQAFVPASPRRLNTDLTNDALHSLAGDLHPGATVRPTSSQPPSAGPVPLPIPGGSDRSHTPSSDRQDTERSTHSDVWDPVAKPDASPAEHVPAPLRRKAMDPSAYLPAFQPPDAYPRCPTYPHRIPWPLSLTPRHKECFSSPHSAPTPLR